MLRPMITAMMVMAVASQAQAATFCERLAPELDLSPKTDRTGSYWQKNALSPAQRLLVGGTSVVSLGVEPLGRANEAERERLDGMCNVAQKAIVCNVIGPARIKAMIGGTTANVDAQPAERAKLWTSGSRVRCQDLPAG